MTTKLLALIASVNVLAASHAELLNYNFQGYVSAVNNHTHIDITTVNVLDTFSGTITLDTNVAPIVSNDLTIVWANATVDIDITIGDYTIRYNDDPNLLNITNVTHSNSSNLTQFDSTYRVLSNVVDNWEITGMALYAADAEGVAFADLAFPLSFEGADVIQGSFLFVLADDDDNRSAEVTFEVTSMEVVPVPTPAAFWLFFSAMGALGVKRSVVRLGE